MAWARRNDGQVFLNLATGAKVQATQVGATDPWFVTGFTPAGVSVNISPALTSQAEATEYLERVMATQGYIS